MNFPLLSFKSFLQWLYGENWLPSDVISWHLLRLPCYPVLNSKTGKSVLVIPTTSHITAVQSLLLHWPFPSIYQQPLQYYEIHSHLVTTSISLWTATLSYEDTHRLPRNLPQCCWKSHSHCMPVFSPFLLCKMLRCLCNVPCNHIVSLYFDVVLYIYYHAKRVQCSPYLDKVVLWAIILV